MFTGLKKEAIIKAACGLALFCMININGIPVVEASPAIPVSTAVITLNQEVAVFSISGAKVYKESEKALNDKGYKLTKYGHVDPRVNRLMLSINGLQTQAANAEVAIRAFANAKGEGLELETVNKKIRTLDGEKLTLNFNYVFPAKTRSIVIEMSFEDIIKTGQEREFTEIYYLEL